MAVLSVQLVFSMVIASLLSKLSPDFSFARWLLCGKLRRYMYPSDQELKNLAGIRSQKPHGKKNKYDKYSKPKDEDFTVPRNIDLTLEAVPVRNIDLMPLHFYPEYQWLIDYALCSIFVYTLTEIYYALFNPNEFNLSVLWCLLVICFSLKILLSLTALYFKTEDNAERITCVTFGFFYLNLAMGVLIIREDTLEFGLEPGYYNFSSGATAFLKKQGIESHGPASLLSFKICLAILSGCIGCFLTFPSLRFARTHLDALKYAGHRPALQVLLNINFILPLLISAMWVKPVVRDLVVQEGGGGYIDAEKFEAIRLILIMIFCFLRFCLIWPHLQAYLNLPVERIESMKKEAGRISANGLKMSVTGFYYYLCVAALQYLTPLMLLLFLTMLLKTMGEIDLIEVFGVNLPSLTKRSVPASGTSFMPEPAAQLTLALAHLRQVFSPLVFKGFLSFLCWWINTVWFITSSFGLAYYQYFTEDYSRLRFD